MQTCPYNLYCDISLIQDCKNGSFLLQNDKFLIFAKNIDCGYTKKTASKALIMSTHTYSLRAKLQKMSLNKGCALHRHVSIV